MFDFSPHPRAAGRKSPLVPAMLCFLATMTIATAAIEIWSRQMAWNTQLRQGRAATENIARASAEHAEATLTSIRGLLDGLVERVETDGLQSKANARLNSYMATRLPHHAALEGLFALDRNGQVVASSKDRTAPPGDSAERGYVRHHRVTNDALAYLGRPLRSGQSGEWVITLSRRVNTPDGSFAGVVVAVIPVRYFQRYYEHFTVGRRGAVLLAFTDGTVVTQLPMANRVPGSSIRGTPIYRHLEAGQRDAGTVILMTVFDGIERQHSYRRVPGFPLVSLAALSTEELFAEWWAVTWQEVAVLSVMVAIMYGTGIWIIRQFRAREQLQQALANAQQALEARNAELARLARTDGLTGLGNRRAFDELLDMELARAARHHGCVSLVLIDVDFFKRYNDRYGHAAGDDCLRMMGAVLGEAVHRPGDVAARYGGEEFAVLLPGTDEAGAVHVAESLRRAVSERALPHEGNSAGIVTVSAGVATANMVDAPNMAARTLVEHADEALYCAKTAGRNRVHAGACGPAISG